MSTISERRIGVFGGTFDPIHVGHLIMADEIRFRLRLSNVLFLPSGRPPHKTDVQISPNADRVAMVRSAIEGNPNFDLSLIETERSGLSYTADSLGILLGQYPACDIYFLMGEDSLRDLPTWHDPNRIARQARIAVARRPGIDVDLDSVIEQVPDARGRIEIVDIPLIDISSRDIRRRVRTGEPITYQVPLAVMKYIMRNGLYRSI